MTELPSTLRESIPSELTSDAIRWWHQLSETDRAELTRLCDARKEVFLFETFDPNNGQQKITGGRFLPPDDAIGIEEWGDEYFDTLLSNPELMIVYDPPRRTFFIGCHRHAAARNCFEHGKICVAFNCPFDDSNCLMNKIRGDRDSGEYWGKATNNEMHASRRTRVLAVVNHARRLRDFWRSLAR